MLRAWRVVAAVSTASVIVGCTLLKKLTPADAGAEPAPLPSASEGTTATEAAAPAAAYNESDVKHYPDEKPASHATLTAETAGEMRTQAGSEGDLVLFLKKGTEVDKVAEHGSSYLVVADDPKDPTRKLMGWVSEATFGAEASHRHEGSLPSDAGKAADAGAPMAAHDAGTGPSAPSHASAVVCVKQSPPGKCPAGYVASGAVCRTPCTSAADCKGPDPKCNAGKCENANGCK